MEEASQEIGAASTSIERERRSGIDFHKSSKKKDDLDSEQSEHGFSSDGIEAEYITPTKKPKKTTKSPRGINARKGAIGKRNDWLVEPQVAAGRSVRGRGRGSHVFHGRNVRRGARRGRVLRADMIAAHRQIVQNLEEEEETNINARRNERPIAPKLPQLSPGK